MIGRETIARLRQLHKEGYSDADIARELDISYPSVRKYARSEGPEQHTSAVRVRVSPLLAPFEVQIGGLLQEGIVTSRKIKHIISKDGYRGSYSLLNSYVQAKKDELINGKTTSYFRAETSQGEQAQADWGFFGKFEIDGKQSPLYVFALVLSYSRALYAEFVTNQKQKTLQACHLRAFKYLGGVPEKVRYDNMKTVVTSREQFGDERRINWNFEFKSFAQFYHFEPELCPPYYPQSKGKVEASVKFIRNNFFLGEKFNRTFFSLNDLNERLHVWLGELANQRKHPWYEMPVHYYWHEEKEHLQPVGDVDISLVVPQMRRVSKISMVIYKRASYWMPKQYAQHKVEVRERQENGKTLLEFHAKDGKIAEYPMAAAGAWIVPSDAGLVKSKNSRNEIEHRVKNNPAYNTPVEKRNLSYYTQFISQ